jgi:hypothetical protein
LVTRWLQVADDLKLIRLRMDTGGGNKVSKERNLRCTEDAFLAVED